MARRNVFRTHEASGGGGGEEEGRSPVKGPRGQIAAAGWGARRRPQMWPMRHAELAAARRTQSSQKLHFRASRREKHSRGAALSAAAKTKMKTAISNVNMQHLQQI